MVHWGGRGLPPVLNGAHTCGMSVFRSVRSAPPGVPAECASGLVECDRVEWWLGEGGDPAEIVAGFLDRWRRPHTGAAGSVCGVGVLISAAAGAAMVGGATGPASPVPAVPDVALVAFRHGRARPGGAAGRFEAGPWRRSWSASDHAKAVVAVQEAIGRGEVYQACVVGHRQAPWSGDPAAAAAAIGRIEGAGWGGTLAGEDWMVASASPECFLRAGRGRAWTFPIKGTAAATEAGRADLLASVKERAEHVMVVDLERNDLARVAVPGSVVVEELFALRSWGVLWQAESTVGCVLADPGDLAGLLRAMCPPGSVTGTPKLSVLDLVAGLEPVGRGPAMGALGFWSDGWLRLGLTIRTVALDAEDVHVWAGGGITWRSVPAREVAEAEAKAAGVVSVLLGLGGSPDLEGAFFGFFAEGFVPFGAVEPQPGGGGVEFDDAAEVQGRVGVEPAEPDGGRAVVAGDLDGAVLQLELAEYARFVHGGAPHLVPPLRCVRSAGAPVVHLHHRFGGMSIPDATVPGGMRWAACVRVGGRPGSGSSVCVSRCAV